MKKFIMGLILGAGLTLAFSVSAESIQSLIGKQVDGEATVVLDGVDLPVKAAIIEGTTYAPVRAVGEAVGKDVDWKGGKVTLDSKTTSEMRNETQRLIDEGNAYIAAAKKREELQKQIKEINTEDSALNKIVSDYKLKLMKDQLPSGFSYDDVSESEYQDATKKLEENELKVKALQKQIEETYKSE